MSNFEKSADEGETIELDTQKVQDLLRWSFYFSQGSGGFTRRDEEGEIVDEGEAGLHCLLFEFIAMRHPGYRIPKNFDHSGLLKREISVQATLLTEGHHVRLEKKEVPQDTGIAYRYLRMALNEKRFTQRELVSPSPLWMAQKMLDRDWKFLTNAMPIGSSDFEFTKRPERTGKEGKGFEADMSQFVSYLLLRKRGEPVKIQMSEGSPEITSPPEFVELLDAMVDSLHEPDAGKAFNVKSAAFDGTYGAHLKVLIERHNALNPHNQVPIGEYRHLFE